MTSKCKAVEYKGPGHGGHGGAGRTGPLVFMGQCHIFWSFHWGRDVGLVVSTTVPWFSNSLNVALDVQYDSSVMGENQYRAVLKNAGAVSLLSKISLNSALVMEKNSYNGYMDSRYDITSDTSPGDSARSK
jgi:hypothetical protein